MQRAERYHSVSGTEKTVSESRYARASLSNTKLSSEDALKLVNWLGSGKNFLIYQGIPGCGKTHTAHAVANDAKKFGRFDYVRFWEEKLFFERVRRTFDEGWDYNQEIRSLADDDLVIYDDLGSTGIREWRLEVILSLIDYRYVLQKPTMITTNLKESEILEKLGNRIHSRLFAKENTILTYGNLDWRQTQTAKSLKPSALPEKKPQPSALPKIKMPEETPTLFLS